MFFSLEALKAKKGDCLLLHVGEGDPPSLFVIDGGPGGVFNRSLRPRLDALKEERAPDDSLPIRLLMVSHIDDDHINGVLQLTDLLVEQAELQQNPSYRIATLWHNSFDDILGNDADELHTAARDTVGVAALAGDPPPGMAIPPSSALLLASVPQGLRLRGNSETLGVTVNDGRGGFIASSPAQPIVAPALVAGLETRIVAPPRRRIAELQEEWAEVLRERRLARDGGDVDAAEYVDKSVYNLASMVVLLRAEDKEMLLTGDARGDDILAGLREADLLDDDGRRHVDLLKLPHHGSDRNVETDFFRAITADHYVISGDGSHGNPELAMFEMLFSARRGDDRPLTIYLTYPPEEFKAYRGTPYPTDGLRALFERERRTGRQFQIVTAENDDLSVRIDLLEPYTGA